MDDCLKLWQERGLKVAFEFDTVFGLSAALSKIGPNRMTEAPTTTAAAVSSIGRKRTAPAPTTGSARGIPGFVARPSRVINLKTVKALGLTIPESLLGRADEVIQ